MAFNPGQFGTGFGSSDEDYRRMFGQNAQSFDGVFGNDETSQALEADRTRGQQGSAMLGAKALSASADYIGAKAYAQEYLNQTRKNQRAAQKQRSGNIFGQIVGGLASNIPVVGSLIGGAIRGGFG